MENLIALDNKNNSGESAEAPSNCSLFASSRSGDRFWPRAIFARASVRIDPTTWRAARRALEKALALYLNDPNVSLIDLGFRRHPFAPNGFNPELVVRVHVRHKLHGKDFRKFAAEQPHRVIEPQCIGFAVDVPEADYSLQLRREPLSLQQDRAPQNRGIDIDNAVTMPLEIWGGPVRDRQNGEELILSSWHVLAGLCSAGTGTQIYAGNEDTMAAKYVRGAMHAGLDAAVARLGGHKKFSSQHQEISEVTGVIIPQLGMRVRKTGGNAGVTSGIITGVLGYAKHSYAGINCVIGPIIQIAPEEPNMPICAEGDSGAWWLERSSSRAAALHFAGSETPNFALALPMPDVLEALEVDIISASALPSATLPKSATTLAKRTVAPQRQALAEEMIITAEAEIISEEEWPLDSTETINPSFKINGQKKLPTDKNSQRIKQGKFFIRWPLLSVGQLFFVLAFLMAVIGFHNYLLRTHQHQQAQLEEMRLHLRETQAISKLDSLRALDLQKVMSLIDRFNPEMPGDLKFAIATEILTMREKYPHLNLELICATITHETGHTWNVEVVSPVGAMGLMQIMPRTGMYLAEQEGLVWTSAEQILFNPIYNIRLGCRYLAGLIETYGIEAGLAGYNGGERCAEIWQRKGALPKETAFYVPSILKIYSDYSGEN